MRTVVVNMALWVLERVVARAIVGGKWLLVNGTALSLGMLIVCLQGGSVLEHDVDAMRPSTCT